MHGCDGKSFPNPVVHPGSSPTLIRATDLALCEDRPEQLRGDRPALITHNYKLQDSAKAEE